MHIWLSSGDTGGNDEVASGSSTGSNAQGQSKGDQEIKVNSADHI